MTAKETGAELLAKLQHVIPKTGIVYSQASSLQPVLCKPKILPLKSITLQKIEEMEKTAMEKAKQLAQSQQN